MDLAFSMVSEFALRACKCDKTTSVCWVIARISKDKFCRDKRPWTVVVVVVVVASSSVDDCVAVELVDDDEEAAAMDMIGLELRRASG